jgi:antitoxin MazE
MSAPSTARFEGVVQTWGNSLGLRITRPISELARLPKGAKVSIEITEEGLVIRRQRQETPSRLPFSEAMLLEGLTPYRAHADELPSLLASEQVR